MGGLNGFTKAQSWRVYRGDYYDHSLAWRGSPSDRAVICARPVGGDKLLSDEVIAYKEYPTAGEAYKAIRAIAGPEFPKQPISADWFEYQMVDEFGVPIEEPTKGTKHRDEKRAGRSGGIYGEVRRRLTVQEVGEADSADRQQLQVLRRARSPN